MSDCYDRGTYTRSITATSDDAQRWFGRGLNWCYGFNHEEAIVCFEKALAHDPSCAMGIVGSVHGRGSRGSRYPGSLGRSGDSVQRFRPARCKRAPGTAAHVSSPHGDVTASRARVESWRCAARSGAGCRSPAAYAYPHRRAMRSLQGGTRGCDIPYGPAHPFWQI